MTAPVGLATARANIWTALLVGFATLLVVTFSLACYAVYSIRTMNALVTQTYDNVLMASTYAQGAHTAFVTLDYAAWTTLSAPTLREFESQRSKFDGLEKEFDENLQVVWKRTLVPASRKVVEELEPLYTAWLEARALALAEVARELADAKPRRTSALARMEGSAKIGQQIEEKLTLLVDREAEAGFGLRETSRDVGERTLLIAYAFVAFVVALAVVGFVVLR